MKRLSRYVSALRLGAVIDGKAPAGGALAGQMVITPMFELLQIQIAAASVSQTLFVNDNVSGTFQVSGVTESHGTASSSGTLQIEVATGTQAIAAGTNQLSSAISLAGTANTPLNGTIIAAPTTIVAGSRVNLIFGGTMTNLANGIVTVTLQRLS